jgi:stage II sporulation protein D
MRKILLFTLFIILIPTVLVFVFIKVEEARQFKYMSNMMIRVKRADNNVIEKVPLEEYIVGVVAGEMPISFDEEALKAQAIAARTYVMKQMVYNQNKDYDVVDTVLNQVYLDSEQLKNRWGSDYESNLKKAKEVVIKTKGNYLECNGEVIEALFFSTSTGVTENSEEIFLSEKPYLRSVSSSWDSISPVYDDYFTFSLSDFYSRLGLPYNDYLNVAVLAQTSTGRVKKISINNQEFTADNVQYLLGLRSTYFEIIKEGNSITVHTKGYGHGVGMSQYGAQGMAIAGYSYEDILKHYYQGTEIKKI